MGLLRLSHRRDGGRRPAGRQRRQGAVVPGLPHAQEGREGHALSQQDRQHPGILILPAGRVHTASRGHRSRT